MTVHTGRVLIVDDDHPTLLLYSRVLEQAGFSVQHIRQGRTAMSLVEIEAYSLVVLDLNKPATEGLAVLQHLRQLGSETPVLVITGKAVDETVIQAVGLGIQGLLLKPIPADKLIEAAQAALRQSYERRVHTAARTLRPLLTIGALPPMQQDLGALYARLLDLLEQELAVDCAAVLLSDGQRLQAKPAAGLGVVGSLPDHAPFESSLLEQALRRQKVSRLDAAQLESLRPLLGDTAAPIRSAILAPLVSNHEALGVIVAARTRIDAPFGENDCDLLELLAEHTAGIMRNQRSYQLAIAEMTTQQQAAQQRAQAEKLSAVARLAAAIAHEINNPLQAIHNSLHLALTHPLSPEKRQRYLELAQKEVDGLITIVRRTLDFYQSPEDGLRLIQLTDLIEGTLSAAEPQLRESKIVVCREWPPTLPPVQVVTNHLKQALLNILLNAIEAMPTGGTITIRADKYVPEPAQIAAGDQRQWVLIEIGDTGQGIALEQLNYIFEPFYSTKVKNLGLGLTISYTIIARHGGELRVISAPGEHTVFSIRLPAAQL